MKQSALLVDFYELTMAAAYYEFKPNAQATFDLFVRKLPKDRTFLIACGIDDALGYLQNFSFSKEDIEYLKSFNFKPAFLRFLAKLKFTGDVWAVKEGTIVFAEEPILRITAPLCEAQLVESYLLNTLNVQIAIASKAVRVVMAAGQRPVYDFSFRRTHGVDAGLKAAKASYIAGCYGTSNVLAGKLFNIGVVGTMAHSYVMSFDTELESFKAYAEIFPDQSILLLDTYNYQDGIKNAISVANQLKQKGFRLLGVRLDSGNLVRESKKIRQLLKEADLGFVKIFASGNLDEYKIKSLVTQNAQINGFGVGTNMGVSADAPSCDVIYKMSEITNKSGKFYPTMKFSQKKNTFPGRKQIYRFKSRDGQYRQDVLALEDEKIKAEPLLVKRMQAGRLLHPECAIDKTREFVRNQLKKMPARFKEIKSKAAYPVKKSSRLKKMVLDISQNRKEKQNIV